MTNLNKNWLDEQMECAIREKGAIDHFRELENKPSFSGMFQRFIRPAVVSFAVVCAAACAYIPYYGHMARSGYEYAKKMDYHVVFYRGSDPFQDKLNDAIAVLDKGEVKSALTQLENLESSCRTELSILSDSDQDIFRKAEITEINSDSRSYKSIASVRTKKVYKAKHLLKSIAASNCTHSEEAKYILKEVY